MKGQAMLFSMLQGAVLPEDTARLAAAEVIHENRLICWTDGACANNQDCRLRRAGCGVFFAHRDGRNMSFTLPGREQTNNRAELLAVNMAMKAHEGPLEIRSDSEHVVDTANCFLHSGMKDLGKIANQDLWSEFCALVRQRQHEIVLKWVKGHAKQVDIERGRTTALDKLGNDSADALATHAAAAHAPPHQLAQDASSRAALAAAFHLMATRILSARKEALEIMNAPDHAANFCFPSEADHG